MAKALPASPTFSPIILFDEIDKASGGYNDERMLDVCSPLLEPETAGSFVDEYGGVPTRVEGILWFRKVNEIQVLSAPLLDRLVVIAVPPLDSTRRLVGAGAIDRRCHGG